MINITFEFVGGPNDGKVEQGRLGQSSDAERHYLFSNRGRIGQRFAVASDYAVEALASGGKEAGQHVQRHHYVVTDRQEEDDRVWVRAEYVPESTGGKPSTTPAPTSDKLRDLRGRLLIASPGMEDPLFAQSVVLVLEQADDNIVGVMLNRPLPETVADFWREVSEIPASNEQPVYVGGPEDGPAVALHTDVSLADATVVEGVYLSIDKEQLESIAHQDPDSLRFLLGVTGWDAQQLEEEYGNGDWLVMPASLELIFAPPEEQWRSAVRAFGRDLLRSIGIKHIPDDPRMN